MSAQAAIESRVVEAMVQLGFNASDARVYVALLKRHPATGYELAARAAVPRSAIYNVLKNLEAQGLVTAVERNPTRYLPVDPERLFERLTTGFQKHLGDLREGIAGLAAPAIESRTWTVTGYASMLDRARRMIAGAGHSVHLSAWGREAAALAEELREATAAGREVVVFSFTAIPADLGRVLSYGIPEDELERHWPHKILLVVDRSRALLGSANDSDANESLFSEDPVVVEMALSNLVLDVTLFGQRFAVDTAGIVAGLTSHFAPIEALAARH